MARISNMVKLKNVYANFVDLKSALEEVLENTGSMAMCQSEGIQE